MKLNRVKIESFRNLKDVEFEPADNINVICGENGQGKTNIIEAMWLLTGSKSFLGSKEGEMLPFDEPKVYVEAEFQGFGRNQEIKYSFGKKKEIYLNSVKKSGFSALSGNFSAVIFSPEHLMSIKGQSSLRRQGLDLVISQLKPRYIILLSQYKRILTQRNSLLKEIAKGNMKESLLDEWDYTLAKASSLISKTRESYCEKLFPIASSFYKGISSEREEISFSFSEGAETLDLSETIHLLEETRKKDIICGYTNLGCHRDDIKTFINQKELSLYGSQGQIRSTVLSLKLAEGEVMQSYLGEMPVIFLDDVLSELDEKRQDYLLKSLKERQIFITCCDMKQIKNCESSFLIKEGRIV